MANAEGFYVMPRCTGLWLAVLRQRQIVLRACPSPSPSQTLSLFSDFFTISFLSQKKLETTKRETFSSAEFFLFFLDFDLEVPGDFCLLTFAAIISFIFSLSDGFCARTRRGELFSCAVWYNVEVLDSFAALARSLLGMPRCRRLWLAAREQSATLFARA